MSADKLCGSGAVLALPQVRRSGTGEHVICNGRHRTVLVVSIEHARPAVSRPRHATNIRPINYYMQQLDIRHFFCFTSQLLLFIGLHIHVCRFADVPRPFETIGHSQIVREFNDGTFDKLLAIINNEVVRFVPKFVRFHGPLIFRQFPIVIYLLYKYIYAL